MILGLSLLDFNPSFINSSLYLLIYTLYNTSINTKNITHSYYFYTFDF